MCPFRQQNNGHTFRACGVKEQQFRAANRSICRKKQAGALQQPRRGKFILRRLLGALKTAGGEASASTGDTTSASHGAWSPCGKPRFLLHHSHFTTPNRSFSLPDTVGLLSLHPYLTHNLPLRPRSLTTYIHDSTTHTTDTRTAATQIAKDKRPWQTLRSECS
jgi:hypothetical protein